MYQLKTIKENIYSNIFALLLWCLWFVSRTFITYIISQVFNSNTNSGPGLYFPRCQMCFWYAWYPRAEVIVVVFLFKRVIWQLKRRIKKKYYFKWFFSSSDFISDSNVPCLAVINLKSLHQTTNIELNFHWIGPLGRFSLVVAKFVHNSYLLSYPLFMQFFFKYWS